MCDKFKDGLTPKTFNRMFDVIEKSYVLQSETHFRSKKIQTTKYIGETPSYLCPKLWTSLPEDYKSLSSPEKFKVRIKT